MYNASGLCHACEGGWNTGSSLEACMPCPEGHYCPAGLNGPGTGCTEPLLCPAGSWNNAQNMSACAACPLGHFCLGGYDCPQLCYAMLYATCYAIRYAICYAIC